MSLTLHFPETVNASAAQRPSKEPHVNWYADIAGRPVENRHARVVFGTLHAADAEGLAEVTVACTMQYDDEQLSDTGEFQKALETSAALETLYDVARLALRSVAGLVGISAEVPTKAPPVEMEVVQSPAEQSESEQSEAEERGGARLVAD